MDKKMYTQARYLHISEVFMRPALIEFIPWLEKTQPDMTQYLTMFLAEVTEKDKLSTNGLSSLLENHLFAEILFKQSQDHIRLDNGYWSSVWMSYIYIYSWNEFACAAALYPRK